MATRDKYSSNHTIEVTGDTQTVTIKDNLTVNEVTTTANLVVSDEVTGDLNVSQSVNATLDVTADRDIIGAGDLTITDDATVGGDLSVTGTVTTDSFTYSSAKEIIIHYPLGSFYQEVNATKNNASVSIIDSPNIAGYPVVSIGHASNTTWDVSFAADGVLPARCKVTGVVIYANNASGESQFELTASLMSAVAILAGTTWTTQDTATFTLSNTSTSRDKAIFNFEDANLSPHSQFVRVKIAKTDGDAATMYVYKVQIKVEVSTVEQGLGEIVA